jgi:hypothetical protein
VGKEIDRQVHEGEIVEPKPQSNGIPAGDRGQGSGNSGKSIQEWRAGRGAV